MPNALLVFLYLFLFHYFKIDLLLADTTTNGGDTVSHNLLAYHLKEGLLTKGKIIGWFQGAAEFGGRVTELGKTQQFGRYGSDLIQAGTGPGHMQRDS